MGTHVRRLEEWGNCLHVELVVDCAQPLQWARGMQTHALPLEKGRKPFASFVPDQLVAAGKWDHGRDDTKQSE